MFNFLLYTTGAIISIYTLTWLGLFAILPLAFLFLLIDRIR